MNWYLVVKFLHIAAVIVSVGGLFARQLIRSEAARLDDVRSFATASQAAFRIERVMVIPGMNVVLVLGIILGFMGHYPILGFIQGGQQNWLLASNILLISVLLVIITIFLPRNKRLEPNSAARTGTRRDHAGASRSHERSDGHACASL